MAFIIANGGGQTDEDKVETLESSSCVTCYFNAPSRLPPRRADAAVALSDRALGTIDQISRDEGSSLDMTYYLTSDKQKI